MMILSVDIINIYLLIKCPKYHDNYILNIFLKNISIYIGKIGSSLLIILNIMINI